ncbi:MULTISPECIES: hypothetical protein [unclassified Cryobacterium]|nr:MULTISPECIES: hypothetical protein [unclassified Cryobacterium]
MTAPTVPATTSLPTWLINTVLGTGCVAVFILAGAAAQGIGTFLAILAR